MIVVKIELHSARTHKVTQLGELHLSNDDKASRENPRRGTYRVELFRKPKFTSVLKGTVVEDWPRLDKPIWQLLQKALNQLYPND